MMCLKFLMCKVSQTLETSQNFIPGKKKEVVQETLKLATTTPSRVEQLAIVSSWVFSLGPRCSPKNSPSLVPVFSILLYFCTTHEQTVTYPSVLREPNNDPISSNHIFLPVLGAVLSKLHTLTQLITLWHRFYNYLCSQIRGVTKGVTRAGTISHGAAGGKNPVWSAPTSQSTRQGS